MNSLFDKMKTVFPDFCDDIKGKDIEALKASIFRDFYYRYLIEFEVDIDNIKKVQLAQQVTEEEEMIPTINFVNSINLLIPHHCLELFDLIVPSTNFIAPKINFAIKFLDFSDTTLSSIYVLSNPFIDAKNNIKRHAQETFDKRERTKHVLSLKIPHKGQQIDEIEAKCKVADGTNNEIINEMRVLEQTIEQITIRNEMLMRKSQQSESTLKNIKDKLESRKLKLNRSLDCNEQLVEMEQQLTEIRNDITKTRDKIEIEMKSQVDQSKLADILSERSSSVKKIVYALSTQKHIEEAIKQKEVLAKEKGGASSLEEINSIIIAQQKETEKLLSSHLKERKRVENSIERNREFGSNKLKLQSLKNKFKDIKSDQRKIQELEDQINKTNKSFIQEQNKLKQMEEDIVKDKMTSAHCYKEMSSTILDRFKKSRDDMGDGKEKK